MNLGISRYSVASLLLLYLAGCAATPKQVASAARKDLSCPSAEVTEIGEDRYGASGCGRGAVYARVCDDQGCRWGRLRHGHEMEVATQSAPLVAPAEAREVLPAPAPEAREVLPAPAPSEREILPAPPPTSEGAAPSEKPETAPDGTAPANDASSAAPAPAPVPLSQGELSAPYDATVPERPEAQRSAYAPPQPLVDDRPPPPAPYYNWVGGYWWWGAGGWVWLPGYWTQPMVGFNYFPGYWYWSMNYWWYWPGGWARPGSTTIVYRTAPRPERVVRVRSFTPRASGAGVVSRAPATRSVGRATAVSGFRPSGSPLLRYPTQVRASPQGSRAARSTNLGAARSVSGVGQVVRPGMLSPRPRSFTTSRAVRPSPAATRAVTPSRSQSPAIRYSAPRSSSPRFYSPRAAPPARAPSIGRPQRR